jgi:hypothetical protein
MSRLGLSVVQAQVAEVKAVSDAMAADPDALAGTGVTIAGVKYMYISGDKQQVYAKKVPCVPWPREAVAKPMSVPCSRFAGGTMLAAGSPSYTTEYRIAQGNTGVVFYKCKTCMIVATHSARAPKPRPHATTARACLLRGSPWRPHPHRSPRPTPASEPHSDDTIQPGNCKNAVSKLGDYLVENSV